MTIASLASGATGCQVPCLVLHLKTTDILLEQQRDHAVVGVSARAKLTRRDMVDTTEDG